jgi:hypothetical protein
MKSSKFLLFSFLLIAILPNVKGQTRINATITTVYNGCGNFTFTLNQKPGPSIKQSSIKWSGTDGLVASGVFSTTHHYRKPSKNTSDTNHIQVSFTDSAGSYYETIFSSFYVPPYIYVELPKDTMVCVGTTVAISPIVAGGRKPSYHWSDGDTTASISPNIIKDTVFVLTVSDGCTNWDSMKITVDNTCVWPGDANADKKVDNKDILTIGLGFDNVGHPRPNATNGWYGQPSPDWIDTIRYGVNYKQVDCNGDSSIDYSDTVAVKANYSKTHFKTTPFNQGKPTDPPLRIIFNKDSALGGDVVQADIMYGTIANKAFNIYGLAFSILYNDALVDTVFVDFNSGWLSAKPLTLGSIPFKGQIDLAEVRTGHTDTSGYGKIASLYFRIKNNLPMLSNKLIIRFADNIQIDSKDRYMPAYMLSDSILIKRTTAGIESSNYDFSSVHVYPNPANTELIISFPTIQKWNVQLMDMTGRILKISEVSKTSEVYKLNTFELIQGMYLLKISNEIGVIQKRIMVTH